MIPLRILLLCTVTMTAVSTGSFTPTKYELTVTPDFNEKTFTAKVLILVGVTGAVKEFDLSVSKELHIERVSFFMAQHEYRGHPQLLGQTVEFKFDEETDRLHVTLLSDVTSESIKLAGYIEVEYKGKIGAVGANKGLYHIDNNTFETNLKNGNTIALIPILSDARAVQFNLFVITPYRAGVDTPLKAAEHKDVPSGELFSNNYSSGEEKIHISDVYFKIHAPTVLVLDG